mmetsp:Transcript_38025/g.63181  ORF Transcript_38025/g.63181 Transcript_38025/m.63181 type:complete len:223 (-) Transcript_38025:438-1106(-)
MMTGMKRHPILPHTAAKSGIFHRWQAACICNSELLRGQRHVVRGLKCHVGGLLKLVLLVVLGFGLRDRDRFFGGQFRDEIGEEPRPHVGQREWELVRLLRCHLGHPHAHLEPPDPVISNLLPLDRSNVAFLEHCGVRTLGAVESVGVPFADVEVLFAVRGDRRGVVPLRGLRRWIRTELHAAVGNRIRRHHLVLLSLAKQLALIKMEFRALWEKEGALKRVR